MLNLYKVLNVRQNAPQSAISSSYACLKEKYTKDCRLGNFEDEARLINIDYAFEILTDPVKRDAYDDKLAEQQFNQAPTSKSTNIQTITSTGTRATNKRILPALLLFLFFGLLSAHRFYVGKIGTGIIQTLTFGGLGIWWLIDLYMIVSGSFTDKDGNKISQWT